MSTGNENEDIAKELDEILNLYNQKLKNQIKEADEQEQHAFLEKFEHIKVEVIKPMMVKIGKYMEKKGHAYQIKDETTIYHDNPSLKMEIYPKTSPDFPIQEHEFPRITFIAEPDIGEIGIEVRDGMPGRPGLTRGHMIDLESLTEEYVKGHIIYLIKRNFGKIAI